MGRGGGEGAGQRKGKGILIGQLIGEQCNYALIQSTLPAPLRQSKLFAPFLCNYFKQFCALILLRKENLKRKKKERKKENIAHLWVPLFDNLPIAVSKSNVVTVMDWPVAVLKSDACFTVEFLNRFVHIRRDMACVLRKKLSLSLAHTDCRHFSSETILLASFVTRP